jgi:hypothetical protein
MGLVRHNSPPAATRIPSPPRGGRPKPWPTSRGFFLRIGDSGWARKAPPLARRGRSPLDYPTRAGLLPGQELDARHQYETLAEPWNFGCPLLINSLDCALRCTGMMRFSEHHSNSSDGWSFALAAVALVCAPSDRENNRQVVAKREEGPPSYGATRPRRGSRAHPAAAWVKGQRGRSQRRVEIAPRP